MITGGIDCDILNASSIKEKARDATSTPLPKAIITAIVLLESLVVSASRQPKSRGTLTTNPQNREPAILVRSTAILLFTSLHVYLA